MSNEDCLPLFCIERNKDELKAQALLAMSISNRATKTRMASNGGFSTNEILSIFIRFGYCLRIKRVDLVVFVLFLGMG